ncbi:3-deoxy-7-phosphoheptulonate synthase [Anaerotalea alkaliphila]|uniref:3-deoxy-7-phosphoheptulonate synthase n=1 Tax=Anaerotalea alkaliphila TaxID=2662126 RepID=A0A7X5HT40_9FIRM|nr:3-deoxy-7-phosphoheptulonate synthase [Anaerotalea alkaliphila]NDL66185.1 3-deoxy-7-phosphoheptulonate synthase [Anaerotalea alkaliphila]
MIIVMKPNAPEKTIENVISIVEEKGLQTHLSRGEQVTIIGVIGDKTRLEGSNIDLLDGVEKVTHITESYKLANKKFHAQPSIVTVGNARIGSDELVFMAGPCSIESEEQVFTVARALKASGAQILRGGAFKPRTSPYAFQGLEEQGLKLMAEAGKETGMAIVSEVTSLAAVEAAYQHVDMFQIGARNMQNFYLLKEVGKTDKPVLLKRGLAATIDEWLNAAEYIMSEGNHQVVLCERGIRTFETATRNTLDISAVPVVKSKSHLPIIVDPSHATGIKDLVPSMSRASIAAGADGLMIEVHPTPATALSDGAQSLTPQEFDRLCRELLPFANLMGRHF